MKALKQQHCLFSKGYCSELRVLLIEFEETLVGNKKQFHRVY